MKRILTTLKKKWPEYLLEILVLVIGIYGAFALENWNQNRKARNAEIELLTNLKSDFEIRLAEIEDIQSVRQSLILNIDTLYQIADGSIAMPIPEKIDQLLSTLYVSYRFNDQFSALNMLFSTGGINELSSKNLRHLLIKWPWLVQEMIEEQDRIETYVLEMQKTMAPYISANNLMQQAKWGGESLSGNLSNDHFAIDYTSLFKDRRFMDLVVHKRTNLLFNIKDGKALMDHGYIIINTIDKGINQ